MSTNLISCNRGKKSARDNHIKDDETNKGTQNEFEKALVPFMDKKCDVSYAKTDVSLIEKYQDFKMVDDRSIVDQICDLQGIAIKLEENKMPLVEKYQIGMAIAKLPPSWHDFAFALKQSQDKLSMNDLIGAIEIEENARAKNTKFILEILNKMNQEMDSGACCWSCRNMGYVTDSCTRRKTPIKKIITCEPYTYSVKSENELSTQNQLYSEDDQIKVSKSKVRRRKSVPQSTKKISKKNKEKIIGACWACRKIGYWTDKCTRRKNITQKARTICMPRTKCNHLHSLE